MTDWFNHPRYVTSRRRIVELIREDQYDFFSLKKVVFLCGGNPSPTRDALRAYLERHSKQVVPFYAEAVWAVLAARATASNALEMEEKLAALADIVMVVVESPGTFAEIGAFAMSPGLRKKLLPILDQKHFGRESFIETGPVRWIDIDSTFSPSIWTNLRLILTAANDIEDRLKRIKPTDRTFISRLAASQKHLLFFICDLVAVFGPCSQTHVAATLIELQGPGSDQDVAMHLGLGKAMGLLGSFELAKDEYFYRVLNGGVLTSFHRTKHLRDLPTMRSEMLSAMQVCPPCSEVLAKLATLT